MISIYSSYSISDIKLQETQRKAGEKQKRRASWLITFKQILYQERKSYNICPYTKNVLSDVALSWSDCSEYTVLYNALKKAYPNCVSRLFKGWIDKLHIVIEQTVHIEVRKWFEQDAEIPKCVWQCWKNSYKLDGRNWQTFANVCRTVALALTFDLPVDSIWSVAPG